MLHNLISLRNVASISLGLLALGALAAVTLPLTSRTARAEGRSGELHMTKNCVAFTGNPGSYCAVTASNLHEIVIGSQIFYDQPSGVPGLLEGGLDSNVVLYVGTGDWAVGRCTLDGTTNLGLCIFSDGTGSLAGFHARAIVSSTDGVNYALDGTYSFGPERQR